ncbi:hypothetical protein ACROYT_G022936 [Oculina patagonica]
MEKEKTLEEPGIEMEEQLEEPGIEIRDEDEEVDVVGDDETEDEPVKRARLQVENERSPATTSGATENGASTSDEEEWNDDGDELLVDSVDQTERQLTYQEQLGGSAAASEPGRFQFNLNPYVDRVSESMGVRERHYMANLRQRGQFITRQNLHAELRDAVYEALQNLIRREGIPDRDHVYFNLASNRINHVYGYRRLPASEWLAGSSRVDGILDQMARVLNSNESFEMDDTFQLSFTHVRAPLRGSGKRKRKPGHSHPETHKRLKHSVVTVKNKDDLCCARAIVTAKAKVDNHPNWHGFQKGTKIQYEQALLLHHEADVPFGPFGYEELQKFSLAPSLYEYQLLLVDETRGYRVLTFGPPQDKKLVLVYNDNHYDVITSLPGYFIIWKQSVDEFHKRLEDRCADDVYQCTQKKIQFLKDKGYNVVTVWECEWERMKKEKEEIKAFLNDLDIMEPLNPRDAFCGGRTNAVKLYHQADEENEEEIKYYDYTSLYPYVNKNSTYPIGHPDIVFQPGHTDISCFFGIAKCTVLPPYGLFHPVLPLRQNDKLTFPLCRTCVEEEMAKPMLDRTFVCSHTVEQRKITGTWCTPELEVAVEKGYKILRIRNYVNTWLKIKEEASGWPSHVGDDPEKQRQYVEDYFAREGIPLDPSNIKKNPGLRTLAKLMLNSMWGKFGQKPNKTQVREFDDPVAFSEFHESDKYDIRYVSVLTEQRVEIHFKHKLEDDPVSPNLNIFVAAFTTCWARLRLYEALDLLQERVLYFDTDSVVFVTRPGEQNPSLGDYLGDFKDELSTGDYIIEFASGGPKNYGYLTKNGKEECKVRGISLNSEGSKQLNYRVLRQNVIDDIQQPLQSGVRQTDVVKPYHIVRNAKQYAIETVPQTKKYQMVFSKRVIDTASFYTYPYGYSQWNPEDDEMLQMLCDL